jgi:hypothetical protein
MMAPPPIVVTGEGIGWEGCRPQGAHEQSCIVEGDTCPPIRKETYSARLTNARNGTPAAPLTTIRRSGAADAGPWALLRCGGAGRESERPSAATGFTCRCPHRVGRRCLLFASARAFVALVAALFRRRTARWPDVTAGASPCEAPEPGGPLKRCCVVQRHLDDMGSLVYL